MVGKCATSKQTMSTHARVRPLHAPVTVKAAGASGLRAPRHVEAMGRKIVHTPFHHLRYMADNIVAVQTARWTMNQPNLDNVVNKLNAPTTVKVTGVVGRNAQRLADVVKRLELFPFLKKRSMVGLDAKKQTVMNRLSLATHITAPWTVRVNGALGHLVQRRAQAATRAEHSLLRRQPSTVVRHASSLMALQTKILATRHHARPIVWAHGRTGTFCAVLVVVVVWTNALLPLPHPPPTAACLATMMTVRCQRVNVKRTAAPLTVTVIGVHGKNVLQPVVPVGSALVNILSKPTPDMAEILARGPMASNRMWTVNLSRLALWIVRGIGVNIANVMQLVAVVQSIKLSTSLAPRSTVVTNVISLIILNGHCRATRNLAPLTVKALSARGQFALTLAALMATEARPSLSR